jgi:hypothetical protein
MIKKAVALILIIAFCVSSSLAQETETTRSGAATHPRLRRMTLDEFRENFARIRSLGFVQSLRRGPTGVGHTFEQLLGLNENNIALADIGFADIKAHRAGSSSMVTLFSADRGAWRMNPLDAVRRFGARDNQNRMSLFVTLAREPNAAGLFLRIDEETISARHTSGEILAEWQLDYLAERFRRKFPALLLVTAVSEMRDGVEWFHFTRAQLLTDTSPERIREAILAENILVDLRLYERETSARNHGTGFRAREDCLPALFRNVREL